MSRRRISLIFLLGVMIALLFSMLNRLDTIKPGLGFGRDIRLVVNAKNDPKQIDAFVDAQRAQSREVFMHRISDHEVIISVSGIIDMQLFQNEITKILWNSQVVHMGAFGSVNALTSFLQTFQFYMIVFCLAFLLKWLFRFRFLGLLFGLQVLIVMVGSIFILEWFNRPFTLSIWFMMILTFFILAFQKKQIIFYLANPDYLDETTKNRVIIQRVMYEVLFLSLFSLLMYFADFHVADAAFYLICVSAILLIELAVLPLLFVFFRRYAKTENFGFLSLNIVENFSAIADKNLKRWVSFVVFTILTALVIGVVFNATNLHRSDEGTDFSQEVLYIMPSADASSFLEVQASFGTYDLIKHQASYSVSEGTATWFVFADTIDLDILRAAQKDIALKTNQEGTIYRFSGLDNPLNRWRIYVVLLFTLMMGYAIAINHPHRRYGVHSVFLSAFSIGTFVIWMYLFSIPLDRNVIIMILMIPLLVSFYLISNPYLDFSVKWSRRLLLATGNHGALILLVSLPILMIIPNPSEEIVSMVTMLILWSFSVVASILIFQVFEFRRTGGNDTISKFD